MLLQDELIEIKWYPANKRRYTESGYKVLRFFAYADRLPTDQELASAIEQLTTTSKKYIKIELNKV